MRESRVQLISFSLLPTLALLLVAETIARVSGVGEPRLATLPLDGEAAGLYRPDPQLFWSLRPGLSVNHQGATVRTNHLGLRAPEIGPKQPAEFRILSLGESTTFGVGVASQDTYTEQLPRALQAELPGRTVTAVNAGVSAYSSFQSVKYLELRGLELEPDLVLFYHELNDYLPSALRDSSRTEIGVLETDKQLYESRARRLHRAAFRVSAFYRFLTLRIAYRKLRSFNRDRFENPLLTIGLPDIALAPRLRARQGGKLATFPELNEMSLGRRVSEKERLENLLQLLALCRERGIHLVIVHPAYQRTRRHECLLTRFCQSHAVPLFEAFDTLHPPGSGPDGLYLDPWHPNHDGHARLARDLARFIADQVLHAHPSGGQTAP